MERRRFLGNTLALGGLAALGGWQAFGRTGEPRGTATAPVPGDLRLSPPEGRPLRAAFCISPGSNVIDMAGPWEVFQDTAVGGGAGGSRPAFELFTVAAEVTSVRATGGLHLIPDFSVADAPAPDVVVVPAMRGSDAVLAWLRETAKRADLVMSVCTGAFQLARAGLLDGIEATTHHDFWDSFAREFPRVKLQRGPRFVEHPRLSTAGGLTSGIDLALRVVARYFGEPVAQATADYMEYQGAGWRAA